MTEGERTVVLVRAQALSDCLRAYMLALPEFASVDWAHAAHWQAQRLRSSCERALGTRQR